MSWCQLERRRAKSEENKNQNRWGDGCALRVPSLQPPEGGSGVGEGARSRRGHWAEEEVVSTGSPVGEAGSSILHNYEMLWTIPATFNVGTHERTELVHTTGDALATGADHRPQAAWMRLGCITPTGHLLPPHDPVQPTFCEGPRQGPGLHRPLPRVKGGRVDRSQEAGDRIVLLSDFGGGYETPRIFQNSQDLTPKSEICCMWN